MTSLPTEQYSQQNSNQPIFSRQMSNLETNDDNSTSKTPRELGIIEKLCSSYGFVLCCHRDGRYFFHFSEYKNDIQQAKVGDVVEFETTIDKRKQKPIAINIIPTSPEIIGENRVEGTIAVVARQQQTNGLHYLPDGKVTYIKKGETYFLPYGFTDLQDPMRPIKVGDQVTFNVGQDRRTNQFFARNILLTDKPASVSASTTTTTTLSTISRYRGVISTMKDSFGFIEREDILKEIFFHITEFGPNTATNAVQPGVEVEFDIQNRLNKDVACNISILPKGTVQFDEIDKSLHIGRILRPLQAKTKKTEETLTGRLIYDTVDKKMLELPFGERDRCGLYTLLENDIVQFVIAKDKRDGMIRATQISLLDQSFLKSKEQREIGIVMKLDKTMGGQIKYLTSNDIIAFRFKEIMKDNFEISEGDPVEFSVFFNPNNGDLPSAIRIKLLSKDDLYHDVQFIGYIQEDNRDNKSALIRYVSEGMESTIEYLFANNPGAQNLNYGDKVEFTITPGNKYATNVNLIERNHPRGWIAIIRENKGFIEPNNLPDQIEAIPFKNENLQVELGDEVEFNLKNLSGHIIADNITKVPSTIPTLYSVLPTVHHGRVVSPVRMISNDECEILGRIQKLSEDGTPAECYIYSITGVKNKRTILLPNDSVTFSVAVGLNYSTRAVNIVLENEVRRGKIETMKGQFGFIDFPCEENKKIFFHHSEIDGGFDLRPGDEVEFYAQYNLKSGKPCANKLRRVNNLQRPERLISKIKNLNIDETKGQKLVIVRQPRNAEDKSKGFTFNRIERLPGVLIK